MVAVLLGFPNDSCWRRIPRKRARTFSETELRLGLKLRQPCLRRDRRRAEVWLGWVRLSSASVSPTPLPRRVPGAAAVPAGDSAVPPGGTFRETLSRDPGTPDGDRGKGADVGRRRKKGSGRSSGRGRQRGHASSQQPPPVLRASRSSMSGLAGCPVSLAVPMAGQVTLCCPSRLHSLQPAQAKGLPGESGLLGKTFIFEKTNKQTKTIQRNKTPPPPKICRRHRKGPPAPTLAC